MPVAYKKAPRPFVVGPARRTQVSDNDFTVLLQRDAPRLAIVPPKAAAAAAPAVRESHEPISRVERRNGRPINEPPLAEERASGEHSPSTPPTAISVAPPAARTERATAALRRLTPRTLAMRAAVFLAFGCLSGIAVELVLSERPHTAAAAEADFAVAAAPATPAPAAQDSKESAAAAAPAVNTEAALTPAPAGEATNAAAPPQAQCLVDAKAGAPAGPVAAHDRAERSTVHPSRHHRLHHRTPHAAPAAVANAAHASAPPPAPPAEVAKDDSHLPDPAVASTPSPTPGAPAKPDDMAAAVQALTQAKAELPL